MRRKVLIIDDNPVVLAAVQRTLESEFQVIATDSLVRMIQLAAREQPDIVLVDVDMPLMSGSELVPSLRAECRGRIFLFSAIPEGDLAEHAEACGADGYIPKADPKLLLAVLQNLDRGQVVARRVPERDLVLCAGHRAFLAFRGLQDTSLRVELLETGAEVLQVLRSKRPGMVVASCDLPDLGPTELCARVRRDPVTRQTSIAGLLASDDPVSGGEFLAAGGNAVLSNSLDPGSALATFEKLSGIAARCAIRLTVRYRRAGSEANLLGFSRNISSTGMLMATGVPHENHDDLQLDFTLPRVEGAIETSACVVRRQPGRDKYAYGVQFRELGGGARAAIERLVHEAAG